MPPKVKNKIYQNFYSLKNLSFVTSKPKFMFGMILIEVFSALTAVRIKVFKFNTNEITEFLHTGGIGQTT